MEQELYDAYAKVAAGLGRTVADLMRDALREGLVWVDVLGVMVDQAAAGDVAAMQQAFAAMLNKQQSMLDVARERLAAEASALEVERGVSVS
jgi:hypothetical protein